MAYGTVVADVVQSSVSGVSLGAGNASIMKNRIINGAMVIDQRNAGASSTASGYTVDRWQFNASQASKGTCGQNLNSVTPPAGFSKYLGFQSSSAYTVGASESFTFRQYIEGFNAYDLGWGTANAKTVTLSFWVYSSLTGTFGGSIVEYNNGFPSYPFTYSIPVANTWTQISVTIAGSTGGTWTGATNSGFAQIVFSLGAGSTVSGTAGSWNNSTFYLSATGATSVVGTSGATFYITGVQLEVGSSATGFEYRMYGQELALCQRYYFKTFSQSVAAPSASRLGALFTYQVSNNASWNARFPVTMRATPTCTPYDMSGNANQCTFSTTNAAAGINSNFPGDSGCMVYSGSGSGLAADAYVHLIASAEL